MHDIDIDKVHDAYIAAMLWSETDENGEPLDATYSATDLSAEAIAATRSTVIDFLTSFKTDRPKIYSAAWDGATRARWAAIDAEQIGHDLWLTAGGHGAGFWDRGYGERGTVLTDYARGHGRDVYVGDGGKIYVS